MKIFILFFLLFFGNYLHAQQDLLQTEQIRKQAYPIQGEDELLRELSARIEKKCKKYKVKELNVKFRFVVEKDGTLNEIQILGDAGHFETELIKILKTMPKLYPAIVNSLPVRSNYSIPIKIEISK